MAETDTDGRTVQLRRYRIVPGLLPEFVDWWRTRIVPAREAHGFRVEFAYAVPENDEFVWAVSVEGDLAAFNAVDERYADSEERRAAFEGQPQRIDTATIAIADRIA